MRVYVYGDESGNFDFSNGPGASRYFILTSVTVADHAIESDLQELRRQLTWEGESLASGFHATNDKQRVRDRVFAVMARHDFRVDATILEKRKTDPGRRSQPRLYSLAWYLHLAGLIPELVAGHDELLLIAASIGARDMRSEFQATVENIVRCAISARQFGFHDVAVCNGAVATGRRLLRLGDPEEMGAFGHPSIQPGPAQNRLGIRGFQGKRTNPTIMQKRAGYPTFCESGQLPSEEAPGLLSPAQLPIPV